MNSQNAQPEGVLLVDKPAGITSFGIVARLRKMLGVSKIGHAGTLDPFATGVMVMLIGRNYTKLSDTFLCQDKEYEAVLKLGATTDSYDRDGEVTSTSDYIPSTEEVAAAIARFQGEMEQTPPMFSAKKVGGKKLCDLARKGIEIERKPVRISASIQLCGYDYPNLKIRVACSKGTYIRSLAYDIGNVLKCGAHLIELRRTRSGKFNIENCLVLEGSSTEAVKAHLFNI